MVALFMTKAVFISSPHSKYDDRDGEWYHFPNMSYLSNVAKTVGDWVIFYESRAGGNRGYYSIAKVEKIVPDPSDSTHSYAILQPSSGLDFETPVPRINQFGRPFETGLPASGGNNASAVRIISERDFATIVSAGLTTTSTPDALPRLTENDEQYQFSEDQTPFQHEQIEQVVRDRILVSRSFRDASFARQVKSAYSAKCAMSGLELRNGGGRPEVEAAHIIPVSENGPDVVRNGIALTGTIHWMFDRGLLSVDEDNSILVAKDTIADETASRLLVPNRMLIIPAAMAQQPGRQYLRWHRNECFKG